MTTIRHRLESISRYDICRRAGAAAPVDQRALVVWSNKHFQGRVGDEADSTQLIICWSAPRAVVLT